MTAVESSVPPRLPNCRSPSRAYFRSIEVGLGQRIVISQAMKCFR